MTKPVRFEQDAEEELRAAVAWYEEQRPGLGAELFTEVQSIIELIESFPGVGAEVPRVHARYETRRVPLRRFPYALAITCRRRKFRDEHRRSSRSRSSPG